MVPAGTDHVFPVCALHVLRVVHTRRQLLEPRDLPGSRRVVTGSRLHVTHVALRAAVHAVRTTHSLETKHKLSNMETQTGIGK